MTDPVEVVASYLARSGLGADSGYPDGRVVVSSDDRLDAAAVLHALREAGWRIVRTEDVRPTWVERDFRITEEWKP